MRETSNRKFHHAFWILLILVCSALFTWKSEPDFQHPDEVNLIEFSPDRNFMATHCKDNLFRMWEVKSGKLLWSRKSEFAKWSMYNNVRGFAFSVDGQQLAFVSEEPGEVLTLDVSSGNLLDKDTFEKFKEIKGVGFSPDGTLRVTLGELPEIVLTNLATGERQWIPLTHSTHYPTRIDFSQGFPATAFNMSGTSSAI